MRKRSIRVQVWLNKEEKTKLQASAKKAGLSQETYLRTLINGYMPKELPPIDYYSMMRELHAIGSNLNQIAAKANATGHIDKTVFQYEANRLRKDLLDIQEAVTSPERRNDNG
ncbi:MAG: plasmid mobilization protein [Bacillota bacterium]